MHPPPARGPCHQLLHFFYRRNCDADQIQRPMDENSLTYFQSINLSLSSTSTTSYFSIIGMSRFSSSCFQSSPS